MAESTVGKVKPCCLIPSNLETIEATESVEVKRCVICRCRHFRAFVNPRSPGSFVEVK